MSRKILIGDIHGCLATFKALLGQINICRESDKLYLLGDYVDRGPDSKGVIDKIISLQQAGYAVHPIRGNHEQMLIADHHAETVKGWHDMADEELKKSFGIENLSQLPIEYINFCKALPYYHLEDDFIAVHAGLDFSQEDPLAEKKALLWIRDWYNNVNYDWLQERKIIHGHTPLTRQEIEEQFSGFDERQILNIDCGVYLSKSKIHGLGHLCAFDITNKRLYFQENIEKDCKY
jgi:serine/threonine protein phosphatase 1